MPSPDGRSAMQKLLSLASEGGLSLFLLLLSSPTVMVAIPLGWKWNQSFTYLSCLRYLFKKQVATCAEHLTPSQFKQCRIYFVGELRELWEKSTFGQLMVLCIGWSQWLSISERKGSGNCTAVQAANNLCQNYLPEDRAMFSLKVLP